MRYSTEYWPKVFRRCITNSNVWTKVLLKDMLKTFDDFRKRQKSFWYVKVRVFRECIQYTIYWDKTHFFKKLPSDKKMAQIMSFFSRAPTGHSFIFNLRLLYELKRKIYFSKIVLRMFRFQFCFVFIKVYIFV